MLTMTTEPDPSSEQLEKTSDSNHVPDIEDAYAPETTGEEAVGEDDLQLLDPTTRSLDVVQEESAGEPAPGELTTRSIETDDTSDTDSVVDDTKSTAEDKPTSINWSNERSAHRIAVELKHIETEVRRLLENRDTRRKRRLAGTRRWQELEDDIVSWRHSGRFDEPTLARIAELVAKRHYLFKRLLFVASARATWRA